MNFNAFKVVTDGKTDGQVDWGYSSGDSETDNGENGRLNRYHKWASYYFMHNNSSKLETYEDFVFDFSKNGTTVDISRFFIGTLPSDSAIYKFEIYAAETMEDIYNSENLVAACSNINKSDKINITLNKLKPANYCVLRVIFPKEYKSGVTDWMRTRLTEFAVFASELGDVNDDGFVNICDLVRMKKYTVDSENTQILKCVADLNNDTAIDALDLGALQKKLLGLAQ